MLMVLIMMLNYVLARCSMALVHSRIRRVVYCRPNTASGGLGSYYRIHTLSSLNHRFRVFTGDKLAEEADKLLGVSHSSGTAHGHCCGGSFGRTADYVSSGNSNGDLPRRKEENGGGDGSVNVASHGAKEQEGGETRENGNER